MFKVGEKVRYLDDEGEGIIIKLLDPKTALVLDRSGLTMPHAISKLVPAERDRVTEKPKPVPVINKPVVAPMPIPSVKKGVELPELSLAFMSTNAEKPDTGDLDLYFINNSKYHILVNVAAKVDEQWFSLFHGEVLPKSEHLVQSLRRQDVGSVGNLNIDLLFFGTTGYENRKPISTMLKIKSTRFVKAGNYIFYEGLENPAIAVPIEEERIVSAPASIPKNPRAFKTVQPASLIFEEEVDLHLEAIIGLDPHDMPDHEKFLTQMRHFERRLTHALTHNYIEITFIHGVGTGRLKEAIRQELKEYGLHFQDGPFHKYGVGATVVNLNLS
ncbi:MAG: DUF2027 domain-containing protein [Flavobacteriales bacterium]|nr:DUF2027 domain-containing protein [Flavobacteriales bacterium]